MDNVHNTIVSVIFHWKPLYVSWGGYPLVLVSCTFSLTPKDPHAQRVVGISVAVVHPPAILDGLHRDHVKQALKRQRCLSHMYPWQIMDFLEACIEEKKCLALTTRERLSGDMCSTMTSIAIEL